MKIIEIITFAVTSIFIWSGCSKRTETSPKIEPSTKSTPLVELHREALQKILVAGIAKSNVIQELGKPTSEMSGEAGISYLDYVYRSPVKSPSVNEDPIGGVTIVLTNGYLVSWSPILVHTDVPTTHNQDLTSRVTREEHSTISFWLISNQIVAGGSRIEEGLFDHQGYISLKPNFILSNLVAVVAKEDVLESAGKVLTNFSLNVTISVDSVAGLENFTRENRGRVVLISLGTFQLATIPIRSSINSQSLLLPIHSREVYRQISETR